MIVFEVYARVHSISNHTAQMLHLVGVTCVKSPPPYPCLLISSNLSHYLYHPFMVSPFFSSQFWGIIHVKSPHQSLQSFNILFHTIPHHINTNLSLYLFIGLIFFYCYVCKQSYPIPNSIGYSTFYCHLLSCVNRERVQLQLI